MMPNLARPLQLTARHLHKAGAAILSILLPFITTAHAHSDDNDGFNTLFNDFLVAGSTLTLRSEDMLEHGQVYLAPGTLMGGETYPYEKGLSVDDLFLSGGYTWRDGLHFSAELAGHQHDDNIELEMESIQLTYQPQFDHPGFITLGKTASRIAPSARWHAGMRSLNDAWLQSDIHFGRHGNDLGIRFSYESKSWQVGLELWNGEEWPANAREGAFSLYGWKDVSHENGAIRFGGWFSQSEANHRSDTRFSSGHSHGGLSDDHATSEFSFEGDIDGFGVYLNASYLFSEHHVLLIAAEYVRQAHRGTLTRHTQNAEIEYGPETYRLSAGWQRDTCKWVAQWEKLVVDNVFQSEVDALFLLDSNLNNNDDEPERIVIGWHWEYDENMVAKLEWTRETLVDQNPQSRLSIALSNRFDLLSVF